MNWKAHAAIAFICAGTFFYFFSGSDLIGILLYGLFAAISALVPDIDLPQSKARAFSDSIVVFVFLLIAYLSFCGRALCLPGLGDLFRIAIIVLVLVGVYFLFMKFLMPRHRGYTHSLVSCLVFSVLVYFAAGMQLAVAGSIGYLSHLLADKEIKVL